jgi:hypothetical protein
MEQLRGVLSDYYPPDGPAGVLGYLKGSGDPNVWYVMSSQNEAQHMILGNLPPTQEDWMAAGKPSNLDQIQTIYTDLFDKDPRLVVLYGGFVRRPWGRIELLDADALKYYQSATIDSFRRNKR